MITTFLIFIAIIGVIMAVICIAGYLILIVGISLLGTFLDWLLKRD